MLGNGSAGMGTLSQALTFQIGATRETKPAVQLAGDMGALNAALRRSPSISLQAPPRQRICQQQQRQRR